MAEKETGVCYTEVIKEKTEDKRHARKYQECFSETGEGDREGRDAA